MTGTQDGNRPALIGIDWGTSSLRAYLIGAEGRVIDRMATGEGILNVPHGNFGAVAQGILSRWDDRRLPVLASGMITSRSGWNETPYLTMPLGLDDLAAALVPLKTPGGAVIHLVTGARTASVDAPDVIRGEETQAIGAAVLGLTDASIILPGTHSKWIELGGGRILSHATHMTGEVFAVLKAHSILGRMIEDGPPSPDDFARGVRAGLAEGRGLLHALFHARTLPLFGQIAEGGVADYLSGVLIGSEIAGQMQRETRARTVVVIGGDALAARYVTALGLAGIDSSTLPEDTVAMGHFHIARTAGLLP
ncbi:2-dehydro-3-deoxygalactonokinase [Anianabacter salinae]|uniref:2-dehydro-3-deoxygalactonokinase n=1 Tax=Anianabacter salinae TaxID=2851023 RepID=UPI00225E38DA|nr:2-dehydro-3-deoxygalactonokinase [Anianabacter salinae]MBV0912782.1 2-dehydro-3-deoxygalactonokinase [Anianabacter salinae]